jgi:hypothetical protein
MHKLHDVCSVIIMILILVSEFRAIVDLHVIIIDGTIWFAWLMTHLLTAQGNDRYSSSKLDISMCSLDSLVISELVLVFMFDCIYVPSKHTT